MSNLEPRALCGRVMAMARPSRPPLERWAVQMAAGTLPGGWSVMRTADAIARRVVAELVRQLELTDDPLITALADLEQRTMPSPIVTLATAPEIDTQGDFLQRQVERLQARRGRNLSFHGQRAELEAVAREIRSLLAGRYARHLRQLGRT